MRPRYWGHPPRFTRVLAGVFIAVSAVAAFGQESFGVQDLPPGPGNPRNSEGDFVQLHDGRVLFVYTHFTGSGSDFGTAHLASRASDDGGRTWTKEDRVVLPNEGGMNVMSVSLLRLKSGPIAMLYLRKNSRSDCRPFMRFSRDEADTWSEPVPVIDTMGYFVVNNGRLIQLSTGRLVVPASRHSLPGKEFASRGEALCYLSDDEGKTWRAGTTILQAPEDSKSGLQEPLVVELKDGRLMMLCRTDQGCQMRSYSSDGGDTWSSVEMTDILSPVSPATLKRIPSTGDLLLVWNDHRGIYPALKDKRTPLTAAVSKDEGRTWDKPLAIERSPAGWYCYTAMAFVDSNVLLAYCAGDTAIEGGLDRTRIALVPVGRLYQ